MERGSIAAEEKKLSEEEKNRLLQTSEISLWLDTYDDIFSDFDPRPFSQRAVSSDFLSEVKRAARDKASGMIELGLLIPADKRDAHQENIIKRRLREHFKKHFDLIAKEKKGIVFRGLGFVGVGIIIMLVASIILFKFPRESFFMNFLIILLEPAGWFLFWEGLHHAIFEKEKLKPDFDFYKKMRNCEIKFLVY